MKFDPKYTINNRLANKLTEIERHKEAINVLPITTQLITSLRETSRLQSTHYSTQIEGNRLTQEEVEQIAKGQDVGFPGRERDQIEVSNYFMALEYIEGELEKNAPISEELIKRIHGFVLKGSNRPSQYREGQNKISDGSTGRIVYMPPEAKDIKSMMKSLVRWINEEMEYEEIPAPIIAGLVHYQFATIHPYYDGNGRTARLLTTYVLHKTGYGMKGIYSLEEYYAKNLSGYYQALTIGPGHNYYMGRKEADVTPFLEYFLGGMAISFKSVRNRADQLRKEHEVRKTSFVESKRVRELRAKQRHSLSLFLVQKEVTSSEISEHLGIPVRSAQSLLKKWVDQEFIQVINPSRKARTYGLTREWESLLDQQGTEARKLQLKKGRSDQSSDLDVER